jgi:hypothetical protein
MALRWSILLLSIPLAAAAQNPTGLLPDACGPDIPRKQAVAPSAPATDMQPAPGKALIVFVETMETAGSVPLNAQVRVGMDGKWIGATRGPSWFSANVDPGVRHLCVYWPSKMGPDPTRTHANSVVAEAGKVYYFRIGVVWRKFNEGLHTMLAEPYQEQSVTLSPVNRDEAKYLLRFAPSVTP